LDRVAGKAGVVAMLTDRVDAELLDRAGPGLRAVANYAVGHDNLDLEACTARRVLATNTPDVVTEATADLAWALLLAAARRVAEGDRFLRARRPWIWGPEFLLGFEVHGKTLGVVGLGRIGRAVARRAAGFAMPVLYTARRRLPAAEEAALGVAWRELDELLAEADFVSIHTGLSPATRHLIGPERLAAMKPTAVLVNTARGPVVDEAALAAALRAGRPGAAGLDVFEREPEVHPDLLGLDNVTVLPHLGTATFETRVAMGMTAAGNLLAALEGRRPPNLLNPEAL
jgi:glyoxylate reductase